MTAISLVLALAVLVPTPGALAAQTGIQAQTVKPTPFSVCIDDSDCNSLGQGSKYACFQVNAICTVCALDMHSGLTNLSRPLHKIIYRGINNIKAVSSV